MHFAPASLPQLLPTDWGHRQIAWMGFYELELSRQIASLAQRGGVFVDVGANIGYFSCLWAALNVQNYVFAYEPAPRNLRMLQGNVAAQVGSGRIMVSDLAAGKEKGSFPFDSGPEEQTGWGGIAPRKSENSIDVEVERLDELLPTGLKIDVLKIDTEGADAWVLFGAKTLLKQKRIAHIFFENNPTRMVHLGIAPNTAEMFLKELGYRVNHLNSDRKNCDFHAWLE
jgi:FkbM family methyltransferase